MDKVTDGRKSVGVEVQRNKDNVFSRGCGTIVSPCAREPQVMTRTDVISRFLQPQIKANHRSQSMHSHSTVIAAFYSNKK